MWVGPVPGVGVGGVEAGEGVFDGGQGVAVALELGVAVVDEAE